MLSTVGDSNLRVRNKNAIAPEPSAMASEKNNGHADIDQPMQIFGKYYPTYYVTDAFVKYPTLFTTIFGTILFIFALLAITKNPTTDRSTGSFTVQSHPAARAQQYLEEAQEEWLREFQLVSPSTMRYSNTLLKRLSSARSQLKFRFFVNYKVNVDRMNFAAEFTSGMVPSELPEDDPTSSPPAHIPTDINSKTNSDRRRRMPGEPVRMMPVSNMLDVRNTEYIHMLEQALSKTPNYRSVCWRAVYRGQDPDGISSTLPECTPFNSLLTYIYIGYLYNDSDAIFWDLDGTSNGPQQPYHDVINRIFMNPRYKWFMDKQADAASRRESKLLRTQISFGSPMLDAQNHLSQDTERYEDVVDGVLREMIRKIKAHHSPNYQHISITYGGDRVAEALVMEALEHDSPFLLLPLVLVYFVLSYHFHSLILGLLVLLQLTLTYPTGFYIYVATFGVKKVSLLSSLSFFVVLIVALDSTLIWFDTFKQSGFMATNGRRNNLSIGQRVAYTFRKASVGIAAAHIVLILCFALNTLSSIPAVADFSLQMVILLLVDWFLLLTFFPSAVLFHHFHISRRRRNLQRQKEVLIARTQRQRHPRNAQFLAALETMNKEHPCGTSYNEAVDFMSAELRHEVRQRSGGEVWSWLGVLPIRLPNPFKRRANANASNDGQPQFTSEANEVPAAVAVGSVVEAAGLSKTILQGRRVTVDDEERNDLGGGGPSDALGVAALSTAGFEDEDFGNDGSMGFDAFADAPVAHKTRVASKVVRSNSNSTSAEAKPHDTNSEQQQQQQNSALMGNSTSAFFGASNTQSISAAPSNNATPTTTPTTTTSGVVTSQHNSIILTKLTGRALDPLAAIEIHNYTCEEMLAFDDRHLHRALTRTGKKGAAQFTHEELANIAPVMGVRPVSDRGDDRVPVVVRSGLYLQYGVARTLTVPHEIILARRERKKKKAEMMAARRQQRAQEQEQEEQVASEGLEVEMQPSPPATKEQQEQQQRGDEGEEGNLQARRDEEESTTSDNPQTEAHAGRKRPAPPQTKPTTGAKPKVKAAGAHQKGQGAAATGAGPARAKEKGFRTPSQWWSDRRQVERKWCCGLFGQRANETQPEKEARIMAKQVKHDGYSASELFFFNHLAPALQKTRYGWVAFLVVLLSLSLWLSISSLNVSSKAPDLIGDGALNAYEQATREYAEQGSCDQCSAFFRPASDFPPMDYTAVLACAGQKYGVPTMNAWVDRCGNCAGSNACMDCTGEISGKALLTQCNQCFRDRDDPRASECTACLSDTGSGVRSSPRCSYCHTQQNAEPDFNGPACQRYCSAHDNCKPHQGSCNMLTGRCDCYASYEDGFWEDDPARSASPTTGAAQYVNRYCTRCRRGFAGPSCSVECTQANITAYPIANAQKCNCDLSRGRCTACAFGFGGFFCDVPIPAVCAAPPQAVANNATRTCDCAAGYSGAACAGDVLCSGHGTFAHSSAAISGSLPPGYNASRCVCNGQWRGPTCELCRCFNGGTCDEGSGRCVCKEGWSGGDCSECPSTCRTRGRCPAPYTPRQYSTTQCRALYCTDDELLYGNVSTALCGLCNLPEDECGRFSVSAAQLLQLEREQAVVATGGGNNTTTSVDVASPLDNCTGTHILPPASSSASSTNNNVTIHCAVDPYNPRTRCVNATALSFYHHRHNHTSSSGNHSLVGAINASLSHNCSCRNYFAGAHNCEECVMPPGLGAEIRCDAQGLLVGCDGVPRRISDASPRPPVTDKCGICGGSGVCTGCLGIAGSSATDLNCSDYESDGVRNSASYLSDQAKIYFALGIKPSDGRTAEYITFNIESTEVQYHVGDMCDLFQSSKRHTGLGIDMPTSRCVWNDFKLWAQKPEIATKFHNSVPITFPYTGGPKIHRLLFEFLDETGRVSELGFNTIDRTKPSLRLEWMVIIVQTRNVPLHGSLSVLKERYETWGAIARYLSAPVRENIYGPVTMASPAWVRLVSSQHMIKSLLFTSVMGLVLYLCVMLALSCSLTMTLISTAVLASSYCCVLAVLALAGYELGPVELIAVTFLFGICSEQQVHAVEGYMEYLHAAQSHMFARETTKLQAVRGMLQRTGSGMLVSAITIMLGACFLLAADILIFRKVGVLVLIVVPVVQLHTLCVFGGVVCVFGPTVSYRNGKSMAVFGILATVVAMTCIVVLIATNSIQA